MKHSYLSTLLFSYLYNAKYAKLAIYVIISRSIMTGYEGRIEKDRKQPNVSCSHCCSCIYITIHDSALSLCALD